MTIFNPGAGSQIIQLELFFNMVPLVFNENGWSVGTHSRAIGTLQLDPSQTELYFEVMIPNSYARRKNLFVEYNLPMFGTIYQKSHFFETNCENYQLKLISFCV